MDIRDLRKEEWFIGVLKKLREKKDFINKWLEMQDSINCFIDSTKASKMTDKDFKGIRQVLEKKEGLFRMKMMGKRVNYAGRSVISPDPSLKTHEVGIPTFMAKKLTYPEHINEYNIEKLQRFIKNGKAYPGAVMLEENGKLIKIDALSEEQRASHAHNLWNKHSNKIEKRHLMTGDNVLFNRQTHLHKNI